MELNVLASVLPAKAWWNEAEPEQKVETGDEFMPAVTQLNQVSNTLGRLMKASNDQKERQEIFKLIQELGRMLDRLDALMQEYT